MKLVFFMKLSRITFRSVLNMGPKVKIQVFVYFARNFHEFHINFLKLIGATFRIKCVWYMGRDTPRTQDKRPNGTKFVRDKSLRLLGWFSWFESHDSRSSLAWSFPPEGSWGLKRAQILSGTCLRDHSTNFHDLKAKWIKADSGFKSRIKALGS